MHRPGLPHQAGRRKEDSGQSSRGSAAVSHDGGLFVGVDGRSQVGTLPLLGGAHDGQPTTVQLRGESNTTTVQLRNWWSGLTGVEWDHGYPPGIPRAAPMEFICGVGLCARGRPSLSLSLSLSLICINLSLIYITLI